MSDKNLIFLSHIITEQTPLYNGEQHIVLRQVKSIKKGNICNTMWWSFPNHIGTHVDAPLHFIEKGLSISDFEPEDWIFNRVKLVEVFNITSGFLIKPEHVDSIEDSDLILIRTGFENYRSEDIYWRDSPGLHPDLAFWLKKKCPSIRAVGIDSISISNLSNKESGRKAHRVFLENNILLIEDMKLSLLERAPDEVIVLPLLLAGADGAPCTILGIYR